MPKRIVDFRYKLTPKGEAELKQFDSRLNDEEFLDNDDMEGSKTELMSYLSDVQKYCKEQGVIDYQALIDYYAVTGPEDEDMEDDIKTMIRNWEIYKWIELIK